MLTGNHWKSSANRQVINTQIDQCIKNKCVTALLCYIIDECFQIVSSDLGVGNKLRQYRKDLKAFLLENLDFFFHKSHFKNTKVTILNKSKHKYKLCHRTMKYGHL